MVSDHAAASSTSGPGRHANGPPERSGAMIIGGIREAVIVFAIAIVLSLLVKTFLLQAFSIPSGSMDTTLERGDRIFVSRLTPDVIDLKRGDVVVFEDRMGWLAASNTTDSPGVAGMMRSVLIMVGLVPDPAENHLVKRVIGLPGDRVSCCDAQGRIQVNGVSIDEPYVRAGDAPSVLDFDIVVPKDRIWVMGDHRSDSEDSRYHNADGKGLLGSVPISSVTGRAIVVVWPLRRADWLSDYPETFAGVPAP